ncbi:Harpin HrpZ [Pseudomonas syringae group genomosp. 3]|uniref:Harpin HrpZ n=1 Tax=Pseudomonas syringae group genomosp. 3 TaxID=251701 RepID=A0A2K4W9Y3_9PSED|nr:type III secretion system effector HrpZ [Pseudomonas syringae group genomosp. 3]SOS32697.1 Harpin HrpZ [Pseudomonas syringae group genomosp. 3]
MQALNSISSLQTSASLFPVSLNSDVSANTSTSSKELKAVIDQLVQALTQSGQLDETSPLGKMLAKAMAADGKSANSIDDITASLDKLIHEKLGDNFGASAGIGAGGGGGAVSGSGVGGGLSSDAGAGQSDLMSQVLNGLGKAVLDDLLTPSGEGGTTFSSDDMPTLEKVAQFMDDNKAQFPTRDGGSWMNELKEDNGLDAQETAQFRSALDVIGQQLGQQQGDASGVTSGGGLGSPVSDTSLGDPAIDANTGPAANGNGSVDVGQLIGQLIDRGLQSVSSGGGLGTPVDNSTQPAGGTPAANPTGNVSNQDLGQLLSGLLQRGLEETIKDAGGNAGADLQSSAAQVAAQLINALLQGTNNQTNQAVA